MTNPFASYSQLYENHVDTHPGGFRSGRFQRTKSKMRQKVVDTHIHYWDPDLLSYPWLETVPEIAAKHGPLELQAQEVETERFELDKIIFMQAGSIDAHALREAEWVDELARTVDSRIVGIIADAPVDRGASVVPALEALQAIPRVKGVRRLIQGQPQGYGDNQEFISGVRHLANFGFTFDICIHHPQLGEAIRLVRACPNVEFILDHIAKPDIKGQVFVPWKSQMQSLAALPNVVCKISGMVTEADLAQWTPADLQPYVDHVIECFGVDRVLYGGDWPVSLRGVESWGHWVDALDGLTYWLSASEKHKLFYTNARRVYRV